MERNRYVYFFLFLLTIGIGLLSRADFIPEFIYPFLGDALYAVMIYFIVGFIYPDLSPLKVLLLCTGICFSIEFLQLSNLPTLVEIRSNKIGALIFGKGFLWSDLACYAFGGLFCLILEIFSFKFLQNRADINS